MNLEDLEAGMDVQCMSMLGDSLTYTPAGKAALALRGYVEHAELARVLDAAQAIDQAMTVTLLRSDLAARPNSADRVVLPKVPGKIFKPVNVTLDSGGTHWTFELQAVSA